jgi:hypothetical protein
MADHVVTKGEWYLGAKCPHCGEMAAHTHDPSRGKDDDIKIETQVPGKASMTCPNGHRFDARTHELIKFEWGAQ